MSDAPETITIFCDEDEDGVWYELVQEGACEAEDVKYIRADLHQAAIVAAVLAERELLRTGIAIVCGNEDVREIAKEDKT